MNQRKNYMRFLLVALMVSSSLSIRAAHATIEGLTGTTFNLTASADHISTPDGLNILTWGLAPAGGVMQYPSPTLIVNQNDTVTINLVNKLPVPTSLIFPGQDGVTATGGTPGLLTNEAPADGVTQVSYTFVAKNPGTYLYQSGTHPDLQVEMGIVGAIIVRPAGHPNWAYNNAATQFDREYLFLGTEMDQKVHEQVEFGKIAQFDNTTYWPILWFFNGRNAPDTMADPGVTWLPHQPYNCMPQLHPGEKILLRVVGGGRDLHPFHTHGNNHLIIARDGKMLESTPGAGPDLAISDYTTQIVPGETFDATFEWTGKDLGFDVYGHKPTDPLQPHEYAPDHGKPLPVLWPDYQTLMYQKFFSGSPFLGKQGNLPIGDAGTNNMVGEMFFMWHSHTEKEMTNADIFPGGMMTMLMVVPPWAPIQ